MPLDVVGSRSAIVALQRAGGNQAVLHMLGMERKEVRPANDRAAEADAEDVAGRAALRLAEAGQGQSAPVTSDGRIGPGLSEALSPELGDVSGIRVHSGEASQSDAASISARAFSEGPDIHVGAGQLTDPNAGAHLLAHEATHAARHALASTGGTRVVHANPLSSATTDLLNRVNTLKNQAITQGTALKDKAIEKGTALKDKAIEKGTDVLDKAVGVGDRYLTPLTHSETIKAKGGTVEGYNEAERMGTVDPKEDANNRFRELRELLFREDLKGGHQLRPGTLELFNRITTRLAGGGVLMNMGTDELYAGTTLEQAITESFGNRRVNKYTEKYLLSMLHNNGVPSKAMQIADAAGWVTVPQKNAGVLVSLCYSLKADEIVGTYDDIAALVGEDKVPSDLQNLRNWHDHERFAGQSDEIKQGWLKRWDDEFVDSVKEGYQAKKAKEKLKDKKKNKTKNFLRAILRMLARVIDSEIKAGFPGEAREHILRKDSPFLTALAETDMSEQMRARVLHMIKEGDLSSTLSVPDEPLDYVPTPEEKEEFDREKREKGATTTANVRFLRAALLKFETDSTAKVPTKEGDEEKKEEKQEAFPSLEKFVMKMSNEDRAVFVASYMDRRRDQKAYLNPSTPASKVEELFRRTWEDKIRPALEAVLYEEKVNEVGELGKELGNATDPEQKKEKEKEKAKAEEKLHLKSKIVGIGSLLRVRGDPGPNYLALREVSKAELGTQLSTMTHGTRIWEIAQRMKGAELAQIRGDVPLLLTLRNVVKSDTSKDVSRANWDKFVTMLHLPDTLKFKRANKDQKPTLANVKVESLGPDKKAISEESTVGEAQQATIDALEFDPVYWVMHLRRYVKHDFPDKSEIYSIVSRAQSAAVRWVKSVSDHGDKHRRDPTEADFLKAIWFKMKPADKVRLEKNVPKAYNALANGVHLTADVRLRHARGWTLAGHQTSLNTEKSAVVMAFEDLSGEELLEQWSNVPQLRTMRNVSLETDVLLENLKSKGLDETDTEYQEVLAAKQSVQGMMASWWPSINRAKLDWLKENLAGTERIQIQGMLAAKLAGAMRGDPAFIKAAKEVGLDADAYDAERIMFGHAMNKQRQLNTGLQYGTDNWFKAFRSLAQTFTSPFAVVGFVKHHGDDTIDKSASQQRKAQANIYLAHIRNTQAELKGTRDSTSHKDMVERAKEIRRKGATKIEEAREELENRNEAFEESRKQLLKAVTRILKIIFVAVIGAATFGTGTVAAIAATILASIAREAAAAVAKWVILGDGFAQKDMAKAILVGAVKGGLRAATLEFLSLIEDAGTLTLTDDQTGANALNKAYGEVAVHQSVGAALRSGVVDLPANTLKQFLDQEKPFRNFGRNLDLFIANHAASIIARQVSFLGKGIVGESQTQIDRVLPQLSGSTTGNSLGDQAIQGGVNQARDQAIGQLGRAAMPFKQAKALLKKIVKKLWGKHEELYKKLKNGSELTVADRKDLEGKVREEKARNELDDKVRNELDEKVSKSLERRARKSLEDEDAGADLPTEEEMKRLDGYVDGLADGSMKVEDIPVEDKKLFGILFRFAEKKGIPVP